MSHLPALALAWVYRAELTLAEMLLTEAEAAGDPRSACLLLRGGLFLRRNDWHSAEPFFREAIRIDPDNPLALLNLAIVQFEGGQFRDAIASLRSCLLRNPALPRAWLKLGANHMMLQEHFEALACVERGVSMAPGDHECHIGLATALSTLGQDEAALFHYQEAERLKDGDYPDARAGAAFTLLRMGRWLEGWPLFEARWTLPTRRVATWDYRGRPLFSGTLEDMRGKRVLLRQEQGYGDSIQFARYIPLVAKVAAAVIVETSPPLRRLFERIPGVAELFNRGEASPEFDCQTSLMSLPLLFGTTLETCPPPVPLFILKSMTLPRRVGLCYAGGPRPEDPHAAAIDIRRSLPQEAFAPLVDMIAASGLKTVSLQYEDLPPGSDWLDTAALVGGLDLVITVDTAVAHLAASLGVPTWVLSRADGCWRWLLHGDTTPWYPSMKLYRQKRLGEWGPVIDRVAVDLQEWIG